MRTAISQQRRLDCEVISEVRLNTGCRDEIIPVLRALQHLYSQPERRDAILQLVAQDVNGRTRQDRGRKGIGHWQILVLAAVRLGCNLNFDKLQNLAERHLDVRQMMGIGDWDESADFNWRRIRDNVCLLQPATIEAISHQIVEAGHAIDPAAVKKVRADSFVVETNIHYPTESSLIVDGIRVILRLCVLLSMQFGLAGFRQHKYLLRKTRRTARAITRISKRKGKNYKKRMRKQYALLLADTEQILDRARELVQTLESQKVNSGDLKQLKTFIERTQQVHETARRRVIDGEQVPNQDKLFSIFEPHTQLYRRGKAGQPQQFGRLLLVYEDAAGFITHHYLMPRDAQDQDVVVEQTKIVQERLQGRIEEASFDRGFHSPENQRQLSEVIAHPCLPKPGVKQSKEQQETATAKFHKARDRHAGVEAAIGALQSGNGLARCRDRSELGFERYVALGILGRNLHTLGKLLLRREAADSEAAFSKRKSAA